jgi:hypothetical protein
MNSAAHGTRCPFSSPASRSQKRRQQLTGCSGSTCSSLCSASLVFLNTFEPCTKICPLLRLTTTFKPIRKRAPAVAGSLASGGVRRINVNIYSENAASSRAAWHLLRAPCARAPCARAPCARGRSLHGLGAALVSDNGVIQPADESAGKMQRISNSSGGGGGGGGTHLISTPSLPFSSRSAAFKRAKLNARVASNDEWFGPELDAVATAASRAREL